MPDCKIEPLFAKVILAREEIKSGSIIIPDDAARRNAPARGEILAVGPAADESLRPGQKVIFGQHAGAWLKVDGEEYFICIDEDIHGILQE